MLRFLLSPLVREPAFVDQPQPSPLFCFYCATVFSTIKISAIAQSRDFQVPRTG
jgi:hypothetical protein